MNQKLFQEYQLGQLTLTNRMVMAPMTRCRASLDSIQSHLAATYYSQRASAGLIITEGSQISPQGVGYLRTPGIHSSEQMEAWKRSTEAVHQAGGLIFLQLWHVGRVSHPDFHNGELPVAPSAMEFEADVHTSQGKRKAPVPRALSVSEIFKIVEEFAEAARLARQAGFDGVELHGANGYLLDQFLRDGSNQREDSYGGSLENRTRFPLEVVSAVSAHWDKSQIGYRISPNNYFNGMSDTDTPNTFTQFTKKLSDFGVGYLHVLEFLPGHPWAAPATYPRLTSTLRSHFKGTYIVNGGYTKELASQVIASSEADLVAFGVSFLANPDLPKRFAENAPLNVPDEATFYQGEERGYTDYPFN